MMGTIISGLVGVSGELRKSHSVVVQIPSIQALREKVCVHLHLVASADMLFTDNGHLW